jgi:hypothetical protein
MTKPVFALLIVALGGCTSGEAPLTPGKIDLEFVGISESDLTVRLGNGLDRAVYVRGERIAAFLPIGMYQTDSSIDCETTLGFRGSLFGFTEVKPTYIKVSPGERVKLVHPHDVSAAI